MTARQREAAGQLADDEADLRAGLLGARAVDVVIGRHLLELDGLRDAPPQRLIALLRNPFTTSPTARRIGAPRGDTTGALVHQFPGIASRAAAFAPQ
ncbi:hypothetical protein [Nocardia abscessus]|uniref:hypothetical protein n=1 Tax=Nocardia abscessus TaxID=120957 RepID=UPI00245566C0|nr:hypothetical protein [Nocardia abscessus]